MKTKKQLNTKIKQLELELHTKKYIHIIKPSLAGIGRFSLMIVTAFLSYFNFLLIKSIWVTNNLGYVFASEEELVNYSPKFIDLVVLYPLVGEFILISLTIILAVSLFKKIKNYGEEGLVCCLVRGLIIGLFAGLIVGLIAGLIGGLIAGVILGFLIGLITGLITGLILGFLIGLITGLDMEFGYEN